MVKDQTNNYSSADDSVCHSGFYVSQAGIANHSTVLLSYKDKLSVTFTQTVFIRCSVLYTLFNVMFYSFLNILVF